MDTVTVICYGISKVWNRDEAIKFFSEGVRSCDGSEKERYANILTDLLSGCAVCFDD